jgi:hypothetical protein
VLRRWLIAPIRFYQRFLSPLKRAPSCRFLPTCSSYAMEAIEHHGALVGTIKALWRLLRCNPLFPGGYDPVVRAEALPPCACDVPMDVQRPRLES